MPDTSVKHVASSAEDAAKIVLPESVLVGTLPRPSEAQQFRYAPTA
jgi:hypothetical protein